MNAKEELTSSIEFLERLVLIGGILVAIGVVIESAIGIILFKKGHQLRKIQETEELGLRLKIEDTRERAASLEKQAEDLRKANDDLLIETYILKRPAWQNFDGNRFFDALKGKCFVENIFERL
jgi:hypothetical protein